MIFLLDTNVISELRKRRPHGAVLQWFASHREDDFALPAIALYEIQAGAEITRRQDPDKAAEIERWLRDLERETVLPLDGPAARETARLLQGRSKVNIEDAMIAAIARTHGLTVATRNVRHFVPLRVPVANPFKHPYARI